MTKLYQVPALPYEELDMDTILNSLEPNDSLQANTSDYIHCLLCNGQNTATGKDTLGMLGIESNSLKIDGLRNLMYRILRNCIREDESYNQSLQELTSACRKSLSVIDSLQDICINCIDIFVAYENLATKLDVLQKKVYPWLLLLTKACTNACKNEETLKKGEIDTDIKAVKSTLIKERRHRNSKSKKQATCSENKGSHKKTSFSKVCKDQIIQNDDSLKNIIKLTNDKPTVHPTGETLSDISSFRNQSASLDDLECNPKIEGKVLFTCVLCRKMFKNKRNLNQHVRISHLHDQESYNEIHKYNCAHCEKRFYKKANLASHLLTHTTDKNIVCPEEGCKRRFKREKALKAHQNKYHKLILNDELLCSFCGKRFETQSGLKNHISKHTGIEYVKRKYACDVCSKSFRCNADLNTHSVVHTKEKPFQCPSCSMSFTQRASLKDHVNVHENKFQCSLCQKSFGRKRYLLQHQSSCGKAQEETVKNSEDQNDIPTTTATKYNKLHENSKADSIGVSQTKNNDAAIKKHTQNVQQLFKDPRNDGAMDRREKEIQNQIKPESNYGDPAQSELPVHHHQVLTISHDGSSHHIELPVSSNLVKGQYIDISEMGLVLATSSDAKTATTNESSKSINLTSLQYVRVIGGGEGDNTVALQPVLIPQNWETSQNESPFITPRNIELSKK